MILSGISELLLYPVENRGNPNSERVPVFVKETIQTGCYGLMVGQSTANGLALPFHDNLFWFGDGQVNAGDWIIIYTGSGTHSIQDWHTPPGSKIYSTHWGRKNTMFANSLIVPILFRTDAVTIGQQPVDLPQLNATLNY